MPSAPEDVHDLLRDLVSPLLATAVNVSHAIGLLHDLVARSAGPDDAAALTEIADAIAMLTWSRQQLINQADHLDAFLPGP